MYKSILLLIGLIGIAASLQLTHDGWNPASKNTRLWAYCDAKCIAFEIYSPGKDFVIITFN